MTALRLLQAYPDSLQQQVQKIIEGPGLAAWLQSRHPEPHGIRTDKALYEFVLDLKNEFLRQAECHSTRLGHAHHHVTHSRQQT